MFTVIIFVLFSFAISGWALVDARKTNFKSMNDHTESSIKCSEIDYEICDKLKTI